MGAGALREPESRREYTWDDFVALDEDDLRELVDGQLVEIEVPTGLHEWIVAYLVTMLTNWALAHGGKVFASGYKVRINDRRGAMPDLQYYRRGHAVPDAGLTEGAPDLAVEVVSPTSKRHDRLTKLGWYASIGVPEYWLIDPEERSVQRLVLVNTPEGVRRWQIADAVGDEGAWRPASFPGLEVDLARMFTVPE